jgi:hypothetical protein
MGAVRHWLAGATPIHDAERGTWKFFSIIA